MKFVLRHCDTRFQKFLSANEITELKDELRYPHSRFENLPKSYMSHEYNAMFPDEKKTLYDELS